MFFLKYKIRFCIPFLIVRNKANDQTENMMVEDEVEETISPFIISLIEAENVPELRTLVENLLQCLIILHPGQTVLRQILEVKSHLLSPGVMKMVASLSGKLTEKKLKNHLVFLTPDVAKLSPDLSVVYTTKLVMYCKLNEARIDDLVQFLSDLPDCKFVLSRVFNESLYKDFSPYSNVHTKLVLTLLGLSQQCNLPLEKFTDQITRQTLVQLEQAEVKLEGQAVKETFKNLQFKISDLAQLLLKCTETG